MYSEIREELQFWVYVGVHAFWKGQGDKETIRRTQANIMKQYMDKDADPCHDFYQYACGNWPALNAIPADKAGWVNYWLALDPYQKLNIHILLQLWYIWNVKRKFRHSFKRTIGI